MTRQKYHMTKTGFTIVEALVGITVTVMLLMVIMNFMANYFRQHAINTAKSELLVNSQRALDMIGQDIRLSASADQNNRWQDEYAPNAPTDKLSWQSNDSTLVLATAAQDSDGNIVFADPAQYISEKNNNIFFVSNGVLYKRILASPAVDNVSQTTCPSQSSSPHCPADIKLSEHVSQFNVTYLDGNEDVVESTGARAVELQLRLEDEKFGTPISATYKTRMVFRND